MGMKMNRSLAWISTAALVMGLFGPQALAAGNGNSTQDGASKGKPVWADEKKTKTELAPAEEVTADEESVEEAAPAETVKGNGDAKSVEKQERVETRAEATATEEVTDTEETAATEEQVTTEAKVKRIKEVREASIEAAKAERVQGEKGAYLIYVNGERLNLTPLAHNGRTLVPFRKLSEQLGATVEWVPSTRTVVVTTAETVVELTIGSTTALVDGEEVTLDVPAEIQEGSTFVPVRFLAQALGAEVEYDEETGAITVITGAVVDEGTTDEEATDEQATDEEATDEETTDEETTDEETTDEEATDETTPADETTPVEEPAPAGV